jgi:hypothetical protein
MKRTSKRVNGSLIVPVSAAKLTGGSSALLLVPGLGSTRLHGEKQKKAFKK